MPQKMLVFTKHTLTVVRLNFLFSYIKHWQKCYITLYYKLSENRSLLSSCFFLQKLMFSISV